MLSQILKSNTVKQILGASAGMLLAAAAYFSIQGFSFLKFNQALLVSPTNVSDNAHRIRVNDKNIDDEKLRTIARNAKNVAAVLKEQKADSASASLSGADERSEPAAQTLSARQKRLALRQGQKYFLTTDEKSTAADRINQSSKPYVSVFQAVASPDAANTASVESTSALPRSKPALPNSGFELNVLLALTFLLAGLFHLKRTKFF